MLMAKVVSKFVLLLLTTIHALTSDRESAQIVRNGGKSEELESPIIVQNDSDRTGLCSKPPEMCLVGNIVLNLSLCKSKREYSQHCIYRIVVILVAIVPFDISLSVY